MLAGERRKILFASTVAPTTRYFVLDQATFLQARGWDVHVVHSPDRDRSQENWPFSVHEVSMRREISPIRDLRALLLMIRLIHRLKPQVIWSGTLKASLLSLFAGRLLRVRHRIYLVRGIRYEGTKGYERWLLKMAERLCCAFASDVIAVSASVADLLVQDGVRKRPPLVLGRGASNGVDTRIFRPGISSRENEFCGLETESTGVFVGFVGRLTPNKGLNILIEAFQLARLKVPDLRLVLIGDVDYANRLSTRVLDCIQRCPDIHFLGKQAKEDIPALLRSLDMVVLPSLFREGLPNVLIEAAASGVPAITTNSTGCRDAVLNEVTGLVVGVNDVAALAGAMVNLAADANYRHALGAAARVWALENFAQSIVWGNIEGFLGSLE